MEIVNNQLVIYVQDQGIGIRQEELTDVFQPFFRSSQALSSSSEGFGLGLSIVARITASLGGTADVKSVAGEGSRFQLIFPANLFEITPANDHDLNTNGHVSHQSDKTIHSDVD